MAKRSPILGYNHNVQYRGVVFHVQTEDSGIVNPHIFTHLFHSGVIVNTRKLVYDPDSDDGVVKSLMQSQHKAILKELRRGLFDDKIDIYLADVEGLLQAARGAGEGEAADDGVAAVPRPAAAVDTEPAAVTPPPAALAEAQAAKPGSGPTGRTRAPIPPPMPPMRPSVPARSSRARRARARPSQGQAMSAPVVMSRATEAAAVPSPTDPAQIRRRSTASSCPAAACAACPRSWPRAT
ncbi:MAG: hypothetical protein R2939_00720 [Kofleriaceae bacterium]